MRLTGGMTEASASARRWWTRDRIATVAILGALVLAAVIVVAISQANAARAKSERIDGYYCTLSGVSPLDRGPETGRLCADLLDD